ncbi:MAG: methionine--tRNA ligase [Candidatus Zixiibacteriota bacterium]
MSKPFYITTPIYYINAEPHIGHAYTTIAADMLTRFSRLNGRDAFFLTGTDEHGSKIAEAASAAELKPQEFCDNIVAKFKSAWKNLSIDNSDFIRTTDKRHEEAVGKLLTILKTAKTDDGQDVIYSGTYEGLYCVGCEKFLTDKDLVNGICPDHKRPPQTVKEKNYFFRLTSYLDNIKNLIDSNELMILPDERRREVLGLFEQGLNDFSISRENVTWGIPLPFDTKQVAYVWVEALMNYITGIDYGTDEAKFKKWWHESEIVHLLGKDILKFHCIFWPAILMAAKLPLPKTIFVHGYFTIDGEKMSKTLGNVIDPDEMVEQFGSDATRYLLMTQYPFGKDGDVQRSRFIEKYNSDLANDLGNLVSRVAKMIIANFDGKLPAPDKNLEGINELVNEAENLSVSVMNHMAALHLSEAIEDTMKLVKMTNKFFDTNVPWKLMKEGKTEQAGGVLYACAEVVRIASILLYPILPNKSIEILKVFGLDKTELSIDNVRTFFKLEPGQKIEIGDSVFPRLKKEKEEPKPEFNTGDDGLIDISDFGKVKLVVAQVIEAERVEGANKLLKLQIDIGTEKRQIIAGIAEFYSPEAMIGKKIAVVKNLKPATIRGIESNGMLLAAKKNKKLVLMTPEGDIPLGASIG